MVANKDNITLRSDKASPLTQAEVDQNFQESKNSIDELGRRVVIRENRGDLKSRDNEVGWYIQLSGLTANDDGRGGLYEVKEPNTGTADDETIIALDNGNQAHLVGYVSTGSGVQSVRDALNQRVIYVDTIADLQALPTGGLVDGQLADVQGFTYQYNSSSDVWAPKTSVSVKSYGAVGDGVTDDTSAVIQANDFARQHGAPLIFTAGSYYLTGLVDTSDDDVTWAGLGNVEIITDSDIKFESETTATLSLSANVTRGDRVISVVDASGISEGSILCAETSVIAETDRNRTKRQTFTVTGVSGNDISVAEPAKFAFLTSDSGISVFAYAAPRSINIESIAVKASALNTVRALHLKGVKNVSLPHIILDVAAAGDMAIDGALIDRSLNISAKLPIIKGARYGFSITQSNNISFNDMECHDSRHALAPSFFSVGVYVDGLTGENNTAIMDSHEAFEVHYNRVFTDSDTGLSNIRSCGGSLTNSKIVTSDVTVDVNAFQNIGFVSENQELYGQHNFWMRDVTLDIPYGIDVSGGNIVTLENVQMPKGNRLELRKSTADFVLNNAVVNNVDYDRESSRIRCPVNQHADVIFGMKPALLDAGIHVIRPSVFHASSNPVGKASGIVFDDGGVSSEPRAATIRIYTDVNPFDNTQRSPRSYLIIRLRGVVAHQNSGVFDVQEEHYHVHHKKVSTSSVSFPTTPAFQASATGQANESLVIAISGVSENTPDPADDGSDDYIEFTATLSSGRTNPRYGLFYDLDIMGMSS